MMINKFLIKYFRHRVQRKSLSILYSLPSTSNKGFTLVELLVAIGIFVLLGVMLVSLLQSGLTSWDSGESRRQTYEEAQVILNQINKDLSAIFTWEDRNSKNVNIKMLSDLDTNGRQRLIFVRTIKGENIDRVMRQAGSKSASEGYTNYYTIKSADKLRALGGLEEVAYVMSADPKSDSLYRGILAPIGSGNSLFNNLSSKEGIEGSCIKLSSRILYLEFRFWNQYTNTWDSSKEVRYRRRDSRRSVGPSKLWDSTRGILGKKEFYFAKSRSSLNDCRDDIFPQRVKVTLVLEPDERWATITELRLKTSATEKVLRVNSTRGFPPAPNYIKVDNEWIYYQKMDNRAFRDVIRAVRGTKSVPHKEGAKIHCGDTFTLLVSIPTYKEDLTIK